MELWPQSLRELIFKGSWMLTVSYDDWRYIPGTDFDVIISESGTVRALRNGIFMPVEPRHVTSGYSTVCFRGVMEVVHVLVATTFLGKRPDFASDGRCSV